MQSLFLFLFKYRALFIFVLLQLICSWLVIRNNQYQSAAFFTSSNRVAATIMNTNSNVTDYFNLKSQNRKLAEENARLRKSIIERKQIQNYSPAKIIRDTTVLKQFSYLPAKVINNSTRLTSNYITINKGSSDGIKEGMGVISSNGIVGIVKSTSKHFSTIISLLHDNILISSLIKRTGDLCSTSWSGKNPYKAELKFVPRHINVKKGDTIITSGYNAIFDDATMIGSISEIVKDNNSFLDITIDLTTNFNNLDYVYIVKNNLKMEKDSLEQTLLR